MFKQIFAKADGTPKLIKGVINEETGILEYDYNFIDYTEIMPPNGLYEPIHFANGEWFGLSKEEWEAERPAAEPYVPDTNEILLAHTQLQIAKMASQQGKTEKALAEAIQEIAKLQGGN